MSRKTIITIAGGSLLALAACRSNEPTVASATATLRVINAGTSTYSIFVDDQLQVSSVQVGAVSQGVPIGVGSHQVRIVGGDGSSASVAVNALSGHGVTAVVTRSAAGAAASVLSDTGSVVPAGKSKLRVVHLSANAGNIEIWRTQPDYQTPVHIMTPFVYQAESPYLQSDPGNWEVFVTAAGSTVKLTTTGAIAIPSGERRTVVLLDSAGNKLFRVLPE